MSRSDPPQSAAIDYKRLQTLSPLAEFGVPALQELAHKSAVEMLPAGRQLFTRGQRDSWTYYLLEGHVELEFPDTVSTVIGGTPEGSAPLAAGVPRPASATAATPIRFIRFDNTLLEVLGRRVDDDSYLLNEIEEDDPKPQNRLFHHIYHDLVAERLELPHLPDIAVRVQEAARDPATTVRNLTRIIQADPVLAARLIQVANSALYSPQTPIYGLQSAVVMLGMETTRNLVLSHTLKQLFDIEVPRYRRRMTELWVHGATVSALAWTLAQTTRGLDPDRGMLMGLLHDIGALPVISYAARYPELDTEAAQLEDAIVALRVQVGAMILRQWQFGDEMVEAMAEAENWSRANAGNADYPQLLIAAHWVLNTAPQVAAGLADEEEAPPPAVVAVKQGGLQAAETPELLRQAQEEVADILNLLS